MMLLQTYLLVGTINTLMKINRNLPPQAQKFLTRSLRMQNMHCGARIPHSAARTLAQTQTSGVRDAFCRTLFTAVRRHSRERARIRIPGGEASPGSGRRQEALFSRWLRAVLMNIKPEKGCEVLKCQQHSISRCVN